MNFKQAKFIVPGIFFLVLVTVYFHNFSIINFSHVQPLMKMNDVPGILDGYHATPHLLQDGLRWWHGPWIENGVQAYRPLSSYLLWIESDIVLNHGLVPIAIIGAFLLFIICLAASLVSWQLTHSYWCAAFAGVLCTYVTSFDYGGVDPNRLVWYPVHHDLLNIAFALLATFAFLRWMECGNWKYIAACWVCFIAGIFTKEYLYIFPLFALVIALTYKSTFNRRRILIQPAIMLCVVIAFYLFRQSVLPHPYMPHGLNLHMLITHSTLFWFHAFYLYLPAGMFVLPLLALLISIALLPAIRRDKRLVLLAVVIILLFAQFTIGIPNLFWRFFDVPTGEIQISLFFQMLFTFYTFYLVYKYRKTTNGFLAYILMMVAYLPTFTYLGWHYSLSGWFFRCAVFWPVIALLVWRDIEHFPIIARVFRLKEDDQPSAPAGALTS